MGRPKTPAYTLGKIAYRPHPTKAGAVQARGFFNNDDGKRREITASGKTEASARRNLQAKVGAARDEFRGGDEVLRSDTPLARAAAVWLDWKSREQLSPVTLRDYKGYVDRCIAGHALGELSITQVNDVARIEAWLTTVADERGETAAKQSRKVLAGVLALAERRGAIPASVMHRVRTPGARPGSTGDRKCTDEDCDMDCARRHLDTKRAFTIEEAVRVQRTADASKADVGDLAAFLFGTGARISEALHCTAWTDVDLSARTARIRGTKTDEADRTVVMSEDLADRLRQRAELHGRTGLVFGVSRFPSKLGEPRDRNNVCKSLRRVFAKADVTWAGTHTFRRTVATWMDANGAPLAEIANQLGHADTNVTAGYLSRRTAPTRAANIMILPPTETTTKGNLRALR